MTITRHAFRGETDLPRVLDLIYSQPLACRHVIDFPWRLSSPAINEGSDAVYWTDASGQVVGLAAWQCYWAVLDYFILPGLEEQSIEAELFAWADERLQERNGSSAQLFTYCVEFRADDQARRQQVEAHGFISEEEDCYVLLQHQLVNIPPTPTLPAGFVLRPLAGEQEATLYTEVHRAAFESVSMTPEWRARTIRTPWYRPELDLVITAPDGTFAGFCVGWFEPARGLAQIEPLGVHPRFHRFGLGRILLLEMLRRFQASGASSAFVETNIDRTPARRVYEAVGFQQIYTIRHKSKQLN